jgi:hypothetical protein
MVVKTTESNFKHLSLYTFSLKLPIFCFLSGLADEYLNQIYLFTVLFDMPKHLATLGSEELL